MAVGRVQRVADGHGRVRRAEPHPQVVARVRAVARPLLAETARSTRSTRPAWAREDINEFTEIYPEWVWQYWMHTGDRALLEQVYPVLVNLAGYVAHVPSIRSTGLVTNLPATNIYYAFPTVTRINVLGVERLPARRRRRGRARPARRPRSSVNDDRKPRSPTAINATLTRADGTYVDGLDGRRRAGPARRRRTPTRARSPTASSPADRRAAVAAYVARFGMGVAAAHRHRGARRRSPIAGRVDDVVADPRPTRPTTDGRTSSPGAAPSPGRCGSPPTSIGDSMSHGWGSNVLVEIQRTLLGVTPDRRRATRRSP